MLSNVTLRYLVLCTNLVWWGGAIPFRFVFENKLPVIRMLDQGNKNFIYWRLIHWTRNLLNVIYVIFVGSKLVAAANFDPEHFELAPVVKLGYVFTCYTVSCVLDIQTSLKGFQQIPTFLAQYTKFFRHIQDRYIVFDTNKDGNENKKTFMDKLLRRRSKVNRQKLVKCNAFLTTLFVVGNLIYLQNFLLMMKKPTSPHFFTSLLDDPRRSKVILKLPLILMQCWVWYNLWTNIYFYIFTVYIYNCCVIYLIRELNPKFKGHRTVERLRKRMSQFLPNFNTLRVLHTMFKDTYRVWFQPTQKGNTIAISILALFGVIRLEGRQGRIMGLAATFAILYLAALYRKLGLVYDSSVRLREHWLYSKDSSLWMRKFIFSVRDFRVDVADFYFIQRTTVINVIYTILNGTVTVLLAY